MQEKDKLKKDLLDAANSSLACFIDQDEREAIECIQKHHHATPFMRNHWEMLIKSIRERNFESYGIPPELMIKVLTHQFLHPYTAEEAYRWLDLMLSNVEREDGIIIPYTRQIP